MSRMCILPVNLKCLFKSSLEDMLIDFRERGRTGKREGE